jgi:hypothetical protein
MASKQTRRSISISGESYDRLKAYCEQNNKSMSGVCEVEIRKFLDMQPRAERLARPPSSTVEKTVSPKTPVVPLPPPPVKETTEPPPRVDKIREVVEAKKPAIPLAAVDAASKIFTF